MTHDADKKEQKQSVREMMNSQPVNVRKNSSVHPRDSFAAAKHCPFLWELQGELVRDGNVENLRFAG